MRDSSLVFFAYKAPQKDIVTYTNGDSETLLFVDFWKERRLLWSVSECQGWPEFKLDRFDSNEWPQCEKEDYIALIEKTKGVLKNQGGGKVVLSRSSFFKAAINPKFLFENLAKTYPNAAVYLLFSKETGLWLGASPELLLELNEKSLRTVSLAGTLRPGQSRDFDTKEHQEQGLVTDFINETLQGLPGVNNLKVEDKKLVAAGDLRHLQNEFRATIDPNQFNLEKTLDVLHPTPAVSGYSRDFSLQFLRKEEKNNRSFYSGYWGLAKENHTALWVNLRCARLFKEGLLVYAGGGLMAASDAESEWKETEAKMNTILNVISPKE